MLAESAIQAAVKDYQKKNPSASIDPLIQAASAAGATAWSGKMSILVPSWGVERMSLVDNLSIFLLFWYLQDCLFETWVAGKNILDLVVGASNPGSQ